MPSQPPGVPIGTPTPDKFPQWGVRSTTGNQTDKGSDQIIEASNAAQKIADIDKGYVVWFASKNAARDFIKSETGPLNGNVPSPLSGLAAIGDFFSKLGPLSGLAAIGDFFSKLGQANTWIRVAEVAAGLVLIAIGIAKLTHAIPIATEVAKTASKAAIL